MTSPIEKYKFGDTPKGVCLTPGCEEVRYALDTTGYCRSCKIAKGIPVGRRTQTNATSTPTPHPPGSVLLPTSFVARFWEMLTTEERAKALEAAWPNLSMEARVQILEAYMKQQKQDSQPVI